MMVRMRNVAMLVWCLAAAAAAEWETAAVVAEREHAVVVAENQREGLCPKQPQQPSNGVSQEKTGLVQQAIGDTVSADRETVERFKERVKEKFDESTVDTKTSDAYGAWKEKSLGMLEFAKNVGQDVHDKLSSRTEDAALLKKMAAGQVVQESENLAGRAKVVGKKVVDNTKTVGGMVMENALTKAKKLKLKGSALDAVMNIVEKVGASVSEMAQEIDRDLKEKTMSTYSYVEEKVQQVMQDAAPLIKMAAGQVVQESENLAGRAKVVGKKLKGSALDAVTNIVEKVGPSVSEMAQEIARDLKEKTMSTYSYVEEKVQQSKEKDWNTVTNIVEKMGPIAEQMAHDLQETAMTAYSYVERKIHQAKEKDWNSRALATGRGIVDNTKNVGREVVQLVLDKAKQVKDSAFNDIANWAKIVGSSVSETAQDMAHDVQVKTTGTDDNLVGQRVPEKNVHEATCHGKDAPDDGRRGDISLIILKVRGIIYGAVAYAVDPETLSFLMNVLHSLAFSVVLGTCFWVTFISNQVLSSTLSRQQFELVQSKIYPVYFLTMTCGLAICLSTHLAMCKWVSASQAHKLEAYNLLASLGFVLTNFCVGPQTVKVIHNRLKLEKEERRCHKCNVEQGEPTLSVVSTNVNGVAAQDTSATTTESNITTTTSGVEMEQEVAKLRLVQMKRRLKNLNSYSSVLNAMSLMGLTWHQVHLSQQVSC